MKNSRILRWTRVGRAGFAGVAGRVLPVVAAFAMWLSVSSFGALQAQVPARPVPPRLVNDMAGVFSPAQRQAMEMELVAFDDTTSNQIAVVTLPSLGGYAAADMAYEIGKRWGVGQAEYDNGVVVLIKPKTADGSGEVFIAPGYGLEGAIPDAVCKRIIEDEMIPYFRDNDYYGGTQAALAVLKALAAGEIKAENYLKDDVTEVILGAAVAVVLGFILLVVMLVIGGKNKDGFNGGGDGGDGNGLGAAMGLLWLLSQSGNRSHGGSWGGFSGGGGFGGGGFGGFGGGGFGGGGAGGRW